MEEGSEQAHSHNVGSSFDFETIRSAFFLLACANELVLLCKSVGCFILENIFIVYHTSKVKNICFDIGPPAFLL